MEEACRIDIQTLRSEAETSEHGESYRVLERTCHYRIGVGARLKPPDQPSYFLEVVIRFCSSETKVDIELVEKSVTVLKGLKSRDYSLSCEDDGSVSCEINVAPKKLSAEYEAVKAMIARAF